MKRQNGCNLFFQKPCLMDQMGLLFLQRKERKAFLEKSVGGVVCFGCCEIASSLRIGLRIFVYK